MGKVVETEILITPISESGCFWASDMKTRSQLGATEMGRCSESLSEVIGSFSAPTS